MNPIAKSSRKGAEAVVLQESEEKEFESAVAMEDLTETD